MLYEVKNIHHSRGGDICSLFSSTSWYIKSLKRNKLPYWYALFVRYYTSFSLWLKLLLRIVHKFAKFHSTAIETPKNIKFSPLRYQEISSPHNLSQSLIFHGRRTPINPNHIPPTDLLTNAAWIRMITECFLYRPNVVLFYPVFALCKFNPFRTNRIGFEVSKNIHYVHTTWNDHTADRIGRAWAHKNGLILIHTCRRKFKFVFTKHVPGYTCS